MINFKEYKKARIRKNIIKRTNKEITGLEELLTKLEYLHDEQLRLFKQARCDLGPDFQTYYDIDSLKADCIRGYVTVRKKIHLEMENLVIQCHYLRFPRNKEDNDVQAIPTLAKEQTPKGV